MGRGKGKGEGEGGREGGGKGGFHSSSLSQFIAFAHISQQRINLRTYNSTRFHSFPFSLSFPSLPFFSLFPPPLSSLLLILPLSLSLSLSLSSLSFLSLFSHFHKLQILHSLFPSISSPILPFPSSCPRILMRKRKQEKEK